jgi:hypothetical protein
MWDGAEAEPTGVLQEAVTLTNTAARNFFLTIQRSVAYDASGNCGKSI